MTTSVNLIIKADLKLSPIIKHQKGLTTRSNPASEEIVFSKITATVLVGNEDAPPPLPNRSRFSSSTGITEGKTAQNIDEKVQTVANEPTVSLALEGEHWYIPGVSR